MSYPHPTKIIYDHLAFSDDSRHEDGRYNSLGLVTFPLKHKGGLCSELKTILSSSGISGEFKWQSVRSAKYKFASEKLHAFIFKHLDKIRIDVLIWDMEDSRHKDISGRDDSANIGRMYYQLVQNVLNKRWNNNSSWFWRPDKQSSMDWQTLGKCLVGKKHKLAADLFGINETDFIKLKLKMIKVVESHKEIFVQVADYFAGLGAYSYGHFEKYKEWEMAQGGQTSLFENKKVVKNWSNSEKFRFPLISHFNTECKSRTLTVGLNSTKGLKTHDPSKPINFWLYRPQHVSDKAPRHSNEDSEFI